MLKNIVKQWKKMALFTNCLKNGFHFNVICRGSTYNFSHLKNNGLAVFRCVNDDSDGKRCQGLIHVKNYDKDNITEGDTVNVSTFGKKHSCRHQV
uniref:FLYWCH-type domain-containing protein n=2 Tax=Panagrolaimus superbus TaxID=310955 RepID=A0A914YWI4_9BILA